ncbi:MAG: hypothetical protein AB7P76_03115 [Candidatus Melainabacteria bacterium]
MKLWPFGKDEGETPGGEPQKPVLTAKTGVKTPNRVGNLNLAEKYKPRVLDPAQAAMAHATPQVAMPAPAVLHEATPLPETAVVPDEADFRSPDSTGTPDTPAAQEDLFKGYAEAMAVDQFTLVATDELQGPGSGSIAGLPEDDVRLDLHDSYDDHLDDGFAMEENEGAYRSGLQHHAAGDAISDEMLMPPEEMNGPNPSNFAESLDLPADTPATPMLEIPEEPLSSPLSMDVFEDETLAGWEEDDEFAGPFDSTEATGFDLADDTEDIPVYSLDGDDVPVYSLDPAPAVCDSTETEKSSEDWTPGAWGSLAEASGGDYDSFHTADDCEENPPYTLADTCLPEADTLCEALSQPDTDTGITLMPAMEAGEHCEEAGGATLVSATTLSSDTIINILDQSELPAYTAPQGDALTDTPGSWPAEPHAAAFNAADTDILQALASLRAVEEALLTESRTTNRLLSELLARQPG